MNKNCIPQPVNKVKFHLKIYVWRTNDALQILLRNLQGMSCVCIFFLFYLYFFLFFFNTVLEGIVIICKSKLWLYGSVGVAGMNVLWYC